MNYQFSIFNKYKNLITILSEKKDGSMRLFSSLTKKNVENRKRFLKKVKIDSNLLVSAELVHEKKVKIVTKKTCGKIISGVDGLITTERDVFLSITTADCLPIFLYDFEKEIIGLIHGGWRSLAQGILLSTIEKFYKLESKSQNILVGIGPSICQKHFEVKKDIFPFFNFFSSAISTKNKKIFLNLKEIAKIQLINLGLKEENIEISSECTFCLSEKYFSFRREKPKIPQAMIAIFGQKN